MCPVYISIITIITYNVAYYLSGSIHRWRNEGRTSWSPPLCRCRQQFLSGIFQLVANFFADIASYSSTFGELLCSEVLAPRLVQPNTLELAKPHPVADDVVRFLIDHAHQINGFQTKELANLREHLFWTLTKFFVVYQKIGIAGDVRFNRPQHRAVGPCPDLRSFSPALLTLPFAEAIDETSWIPDHMDQFEIKAIAFAQMEGLSQAFGAIEEDLFARLFKNGFSDGQFAVHHLSDHSFIGGYQTKKGIPKFRDEREFPRYAEKNMIEVVTQARIEVRIGIIPETNIEVCIEVVNIKLQIFLTATCLDLLPECALFHLFTTGTKVLSNLADPDILADHVGQLTDTGYLGMGIHQHTQQSRA